MTATAPPAAGDTPAQAQPELPGMGLVRYLASYFRKVSAIAEIEARRLRHDPFEVLTRAGNPVLWLLVFGQVLGRIRVIPTGDVPYLAYIAPGILAQSILLTSVFYGMTVIWERDLGIVHRLLAGPTPRSALVLGKALSAGLRTLLPTGVVYVLAMVLGVRFDLRPLALLGQLVALFLGSALFAALSLNIACIVRTRERFLGLGQVITMPLFFASNAIYPLDFMPEWLQWLARFNPLSYEVDALRSLMLPGVASSFGLGLDFAVMLSGVTVLVAIGARLYPRLAM